MKFLKHVLPIWLMAACGHAEPVDNPTLPASELSRDSVAKRALELSEDGWIVSRTKAGLPDHQGDSLLFTGLAMGLMNCEDGAVPERQLLAMLQETGGVAYRHPTLKGVPYSLDGLLGLWWGVFERVKACPDAKAAWAAVIPQHHAVTTIEPGFEVVLAVLEAELGLRDPPSASARGTLGLEVAAWASAVVAKQAPAYRLHLGYLVLTMVEAPRGRDLFCAATPQAKMPLIDDMCGRGDLAGWLKDFKFNVWEYAHQRSPAWETPDGGEDTTPGIDWLMAASRFGG